MAILSASQLQVNYGELEVFSDIALEVAERSRIGVVGPNGGGKTSLLRALAGELEPDGGGVFRHRGLRVGYVAQSPDRSAPGSLADDVMAAFGELRRLEDALSSSALELQQPDLRQRRQAERHYSDLLLRYEAQGRYDYESRVERVAAGVGLSPENLRTPVASASGGERTRAALARALLAEPDLLLLDEPTNYLDVRALSWLEEFLGRFSHAFVAVSHDRYFLDKVVDQIWEIDNGRLQAFPGNYSKYRALKAEQTARRLREFQRQQEYIAKEESFIQRYRAGQRSREARGRETRLARLERIEAPVSEESVHIGGVTASRTGQTVIRTHDLRVGLALGQKQLQLLSLPDVTVERGSRTAIIGDNGVGKSTLLDTLLGLAPPLSGRATLGHNVAPGYHHQGSDDLREDSTVLDALLDVKNVGLGEARHYLARFLFVGDDVYAKVASLSGGERSRLALARLLVTAPNLLVLDEPTTHLDIPSREALEQVLLAYDGTLVFVSHDRHLISLLATQLWVAEAGEMRPFQGTFQEWMDQLEQPPPPAKKPSRRPAMRRQPGPKKGPRKQSPEPVPTDHVQVISALESRLGQIERQLQVASERRDVEEVSRLGVEHDKTRARLDRALQDWEE